MIDEDAKKRWAKLWEDGRMRVAETKDPKPFNWDEWERRLRQYDAGSISMKELMDEEDAVKDFDRTPIKNAVGMYRFAGAIRSAAKVVALSADGKKVPVSMFYDPVAEEIVITKWREEDEKG